MTEEQDNGILTDPNCQGVRIHMYIDINWDKTGQLTINGIELNNNAKWLIGGILINSGKELIDSI